MTQRSLRNRNYSHQSVKAIIVKVLHLTLLAFMVFQQIKTTAAVKFKGDNCFSKKQPGICKEWGECPIIKTLIESGEYTNREVVSCGFGIREELICCPVRTESKIDTSTSATDSTTTTTTTTTTEVPVKDFWLDLLQNTTSSTTAVPDFWLDLLKPTTTTTSTTLKPLIVGDQRLNESSEFFDFNALLGGNKNGGSQQPRETIPDNIQQTNLPTKAALTANTNGRGKLNSGPVNINQWNVDQTSNNGHGVPNFTNGRGNNGHNRFPGNGNGNFNWDQQNNNGRGPTNGQLNSNRGQNMGRGPHNINADWHSNVHGPHNNGRQRHSPGWENLNQGLTLPQNNIRPNNFFGQPESVGHRPGRPVNNIPEQNPHLTSANSANIHKDKQTNEQKLDDIIKNLFATSDTDKEKVNENSIASIFNLNKPQSPAFSPPQNINNPQPVVWSTPQVNNNNPEVGYVELHTPHPQTEFISPQTPGHFHITPAIENQMNDNDLEGAPSTSFIQQPVVIQNWSSDATHGPDFDPVQIIYENLANSGMDIVKAQENQVEHVISPQTSQVVVLQPQQPMPQFVHQPPQIIFHQPQTSHNFEQLNSQQMFQHPLQMESIAKGPRSTTPLQQFVQQPNSDSILNVQSPPKQILDPFKPFEFRPSTADENTFFDGNNSLSPSPSPPTDTTTTTDRPAVRACRRIERGLPASLSPHILGGTPAELGEFPHMAALGYSRIGGNDRPPYDIRCGGTLIDKRFVLTAAHCVSERENVPSIVRLGVVNFTDVNQMKAAVEVRIKQTYIHDEYLNRLTYNDIAILELERDVEYSEYIYPVCLYTDERDPDTKIELWVTGWGVINTTTRVFSDILVKAPLHTSPLLNCNKSFTEYGLNRKIPDGIIRTQFCAEDKDQIKDACQGDSGGPLNLVVDESYKNYRLVGVVSSGFGCASSAPGLYTRVAAFLDFIEKIVWPNGGD